MKHDKTYLEYKEAIKIECDEMAYRQMSDFIEGYEVALSLTDVIVSVCTRCNTKTEHLKNGLCYGCDCLIG